MSLSPYLSDSFSAQTKQIDVMNPFAHFVSLHTFYTVIRLRLSSCRTAIIHRSVCSELSKQERLLSLIQRKNSFIFLLIVEEFSELAARQGLYYC